MKIKLVFASLMIIGMLQASENKNLEFIGLGSIEGALVSWAFDKNDCSTPIIYQGDSLFKKTYKVMKNLENCVLAFNDNNMMRQMEKVNMYVENVNMYEFDLLRDTIKLKNNDNSVLSPDILKVINKKNKNKILPSSFIPMNGRSVIFYINPFKNDVVKNSYFDDIKKLLNDRKTEDGRKTKIFVVVDSDCNADEVKQLFLAKSMPFIFYQKK